MFNLGSLLATLILVFINTLLTLLYSGYNHIATVLIAITITAIVEFIFFTLIVPVLKYSLVICLFSSMITLYLVSNVFK